jgi:DNA ligase-1
MATRFSKLAELCESLTGTRGKLEKVRLLVEFLRELDPQEIEPAVLMLLGKIFPDNDPRTLEISGATVERVVQRIPDAESQRTPLEILDVRRLFEQMAGASGSGSRRQKEALLAELLGGASDVERKWLLKMIFGEMQHGVAEGVMLDAVAKASGAPLSTVRRAVMLTGDIGEVAYIALRQEKDALQRVGMRLFRPVQPMLAELAETVTEALAEHHGTSSFEFKFDGARVQIHRSGEEVRIYSRRLSEVTPSLPDVVELAVNRLRAKELIVEGEVVAVDRHGRPLPFQELMRRFRRIRDVQAMISEVPVRLFLFDILYLDGRPLMDASYSERWELLTNIAPAELLAERLITDSPEEAQAFLERAMAEGHEGLMAKALDSPYEPGSRGKKWFKIKPAEHLDLVIVAADWGYGRRTGWLSNYHLAALDPQSGEFLVIGKTFKGLTDEEFRWMTEKLQQIKAGEKGGTVFVRPEVVVEVAYNEVQRSPHYRSGFALRFARITRIRTDKRPEQADTIDRIRRLYEEQFERKGRLRDIDRFK